jgi:hypothetical protein
MHIQRADTFDDHVQSQPPRVDDEIAVREGL